MNDQEQWTQERYDEAWAEQEKLHWSELERIDHEAHETNFRLWNRLITIWILASVAVLVLTIIVKLFNAIRGG